MVPKASESLYEYKAWRDSLQALDVGTVLQWVTPYVGANCNTSIGKNQYTKIVRIRKSNGVSEMVQAGWVYELALCNKDGKEYTRTFHWRVEEIARRIVERNIVLLIRKTGHE